MDRLYPALEVRLYLSASLKLAASLPVSISQIASSNQRKFSQFSDDDWMPLNEGGQFPRPLNTEEDIFDLSGSSSTSRPETEAQDFDEESLYSDALSRKESLVSIFCWMSVSLSEC